MRVSFIAILLLATVAPAQTLNWMGHTWKISDGHMAGVIPARPANISVSSDGALHMRIAKAADGFTGAEMFTTDDLGFGTYQWQIDGKQIYEMDPTVVIGLFSYGPVHKVGAEAEEEIDIEFSAWNNNAAKPINADFTVYPPTGHRRPNGVSAWEHNFYIVERPATTTARFVWSAGQIDFYLMAGTVAIREPPTHVLQHDTLVNDGTNVPQVALPIGMNLWSFKAPPQHEWEIVFRRFDFVPPRPR
jgi:hypothetical protein